MKKIALLIGNSDGLPGVKKDLNDWKNFLVSPVGGAWDESNEIVSFMNPSKTLLLDYIKEFERFFDFAIVVYSGHGAYNKQTILEINKKGEEIEETDLIGISPKQISIFDCCRAIMKESTSHYEGRNLYSIKGISYNLDEIRQAYEQKIKQATEQQVCLYACSIGETALDTEEGGLYTQTLLKEAKSFPDNEAFRAAANIHTDAAAKTSLKAMKLKHNQNPSAILPRCLSSQRLILSINPEMYKFYV